ncbi:MAG: hypothetical protein SVO01_07705, partial [Thermotogota bacterium]|nr:hypothetical protein [Thermotogota bacterium]
GKNLRPSDLDEGKNYFRIAPSHDPEKNPSPFYPFRSTYLEVELGIDDLSSWNIDKLVGEKSLMKQMGIEKMSELSEMDDNKVKAKLKSILGDDFKYKVTKRLFISTLHGKEGDQDLIEEYIKFVVKKINDEVGDREEARKQLSPIFGWRDKNGKWNPGITPNTSYVFYAWDWKSSDKNFFKIEIYDKMMDKIEELYVKFDDPDQPLTVDPFSHPTEGIGIIIDKTKNDKGKWDFVISDVPMTRSFKNYAEFAKYFELGEQQLKQLEEAKPLAEQFGRGVFKRSDFELQLNGLVLFDEKHGFNAFENDDFLETVEQISNQFEEEEQTPHNPLTGEGKAPEKKKEKVEETETAEEDEESSGDKSFDELMDSKPGKLKSEDKPKTSVPDGSIKESKSTKSPDLEDKLAKLRKNLSKK